MSYPQRETKTDAIAIWTVDKNGREFLNYDKIISGKATVYSDGFLKKLDLVMTNSLPQTGNEDDQESANAWTFEKQTYSVSQFNSNNGLMTLVYKGPSKKASNKPLIKPEKKQKTLDETSEGNNSDQYNKNYKSGYKNWTPKKTGIFVGLQEPQLVSPEAANSLCKAGSNLILAPQNLYPPTYDDAGKPLVYVGIPSIQG
jgi:hypothetical protein